MRVIGHRGASALAPENTLEAIEAALAAGADGVECDVRRTHDGVLVLLHDATVDRTTDGTGPITALTWAEASSLDAGYRHLGGDVGASWRGRGVRVPAVEEALDSVAGRAQMVLEIKGHSFEAGHDPADDTPERLADLVAGRQGEEVVVSSVNYVWLDRLRRRRPSLRTALLVPAGFEATSAVATATAGGHSECHVAETLVDGRLVAEAHAASIGVVAWTVDQPTRIRELQAMGVDGVISDDPMAAIGALANS